MSTGALPKYYRQRFLLQFIDFAGGTVSKIDLQKLLFLAHQRVKVSYFDFVPYHYGSYSFQAASDLELLEKTGWLKTSQHDISLQQPVNRLDFLKDGERAELRRFFSEYKELRGRALIKYVYERFPYYSINSRLTELVKGNLPFVQKTGDGESLYTIGYEGMTFEAYVNKLIKNGINVVCDVRKNPLSRKFGFSKGVLSQLLPRLNVRYLHIPELGIASSERKYLRAPSDYTQLFNTYSKALSAKGTYLANIREIVGKKNNVALTCFEQQADHCHRSRIGGLMGEEYSLNIFHL